MNKTGCIIQARMTSSRLPGKILMPLGYNSGLTILGSVIGRLQKVEKIDEIIVATTVNADDDPVVSFAEDNGVKTFRGSEQDVLSRYYLAAEAYGLDNVIRITSDCPFIDPGIVDELICAFSGGSDYDYMNNVMERTYPRGLDCEIFTFSALKKAHNEAKDEVSREHVTYYMYNHPEDFRLGGIKMSGGADYSDIRLTVDTKQDYALACVLQDILPEGSTAFHDIVDIMDNRSYLRYINEDIVQKEK